MLSQYKRFQGGLTMQYRSKFQDKSVDQLFHAVLSLKTIDECYQFFEDICTIHEIKSLAQRLEVAKMLREKKTYQEIAERTRASTATISRVNRSLTYGADGYNIILDRLCDKDKHSSI